MTKATRAGFKLDQLLSRSPTAGPSVSSGQRDARYFRGGAITDAVHRSIGAAVIPLVILRLIYRWTHSPLPLPEDIPAMQRLTAHVTHWGLYAFLIVQPLTGWIATSAYRAPVIVFGWFELPPIWPENRAFSEQLFSVHSLIGIAIACLAAAHIGAALYHHFVRKDRILMRMISG